MADEEGKPDTDDPWRGPKGQRGIQGEEGPTTTGDPGKQGRRGARGEASTPGRRVGRDQPSLMGRVYLFGWLRGTWAALAWLAMAGLVIFLFADRDHSQKELQRLAKKNEAAIARIDQVIEDDGYITCLSGNRVRKNVRDLIITATSGATPTLARLSTAPGFEEIKDEKVKEWIRNLEKLGANQNNEDPNSFRQRGLRDLVDRPCEDLYPNHTPGLALR